MKGSLTFEGSFTMDEETFEKFAAAVKPDIVVGPISTDGIEVGFWLEVVIQGQRFGGSVLEVRSDSVVLDGLEKLEGES